MGEQPSETRTDRFDRARLISHLSFSLGVGGGLNVGLKSYSRDLVHASKAYNVVVNRES